MSLDDKPQINVVTLTLEEKLTKRYERLKERYDVLAQSFQFFGTGGKERESVHAELCEIERVAKERGIELGG